MNSHEKNEVKKCIHKIIAIIMLSIIFAACVIAYAVISNNLGLLSIIIIIFAPISEYICGLTDRLVEKYFRNNNKD